MVKNPLAVQEILETRVQSLGPKDPLEEGMATHSSILAWRISQTEDPGGLQSNGVAKSRTRQHSTAQQHTAADTIKPASPGNHHGDLGLAE